MKTIQSLITGLQGGEFDARLLDVYADQAAVPQQTERYVKALEHFRDRYGEQEVEIYSAPGRSEVGGNHTDHQRGKVLTASVALDNIAVAMPSSDDQIVLESEGYGDIIVDLSVLTPVDSEINTSQSLIRGIAAKLKDAGWKIGGFKAYMTGNVPGGSGLSSSAAFEVLVGNIFNGLFNDMQIDPVFIAVASQYAENVFFGKQSGLQDQMASSVGGLNEIDFENNENPKIHKIDVDFASFGHSLCIVDTKGSHADLSDEYSAVPIEMRSVAAKFGKTVLREVDEAEFYENIAKLREELGDRPVLRAIHFFEENKRVDKEAAALESGDFEAFKKLVKASGDSSYKFLQNVYVGRIPEEQGVSIGLAVSEVLLAGKGVCRVHGGGFAGTIQAFVPNEMVPDYKKGIEHVFGDGSCYVFKVRKYGGIKVI